MLIGFVIYVEAFWSDIKCQFAQIDRLSERRISTTPKLKDSDLRGDENLDLLMLERCRDAVDLHQKVNRYRLHSIIPPNLRPLLRNSAFQTHPKPGRFNELYHHDDDHAFGNMRVKFTNPDCKGGENIF